MTKQLDAFLDVHRIRLEQFLASRLSTYHRGISENSKAQPLLKALSYSTLAGGKRVRAMLVYMTATACNTRLTSGAHYQSITDAAAAAVELIHSYSLIHDDLPAMDDDDLRRGKPSCHIRFGEATAILAGDALQALAFELLSQDGDCPDKLRIALIGELAKASGARGMVAGQAIDLEAVNQLISYRELVAMHSLKTGALIDAAVHMGSLCGSASLHQTQALRQYARCIGLAFQIQDDILDIEGDAEQLGKPLGADIAANKPTYPALLGMEGAKDKAVELCNEAISALGNFGPSANLMREFATFIVNRRS